MTEGGLNDRVLRGLAHVPPTVDRDALYDLPPWRAVAWARVACTMGVLPRAERDGLIREAQISAKLKRWADRTTREREHGVRSGKAPG